MDWAWVILRNEWFAPDGKRYRKSATKSGPPVQVPPPLVPHLPSSAEVVGVGPVAPATEDIKAANAPADDLKTLDGLRAAAEQEARVRREAEENAARARKQRSEAFKAQLAAEEKKAEPEPKRYRKKAQ